MAHSETPTHDGNDDPTTLALPTTMTPKGRARRARTHRMIVLPDYTPNGDATGMYRVITESTDDEKAVAEYRVSLEAPKGCMCPDDMHRDHAKCKHRRRVALAITFGNLPAPGQDVADYMDNHVPYVADRLQTLTSDAGNPLVTARFVEHLGTAYDNWQTVADARAARSDTSSVTAE